MSGDQRRFGRLSGIIVAALFFALTVAPLPSDAAVLTSNGFATYFNNPPNGKYIDLRVAELIASSQTYCYVAVYSLNNQRIVDALIERKQAGVDVRVVTEADNRNNSEFKAAYDQLVANGIVVKTDNRSALMHHKFVVIDGIEILSGSFNFTDRDVDFHKNNIVIIHSSGVAGRYKNEFLEMWAGRFGNNKTDFSGSNTVAGATVYTKFLPMANAQASILYHLNNAKVSVYFNIFTFTDQKIADKLVELHNAGVTVKGTMDAFQANNTYSMYNYLVANGVPVKKDDYSGFLHDKFMVIDGGTSGTPKAITGSYNWTTSANESNDENMLIMYDGSTVANSYKGSAVYVYNYKAR